VPVPENNKTQTRKAAKYHNKPYVNIGVPGFALKIALGEMAEMLLGGSRVSNEKIAGTGFRYLYPELNQALENLYS
jgi:NAD dependent epimerase/dehydratase family enzyme